jgi:hypothetical protein
MYSGREQMRALCEVFALAEALRNDLAVEPGAHVVRRSTAQGQETTLADQEHRLARHARGQRRAYPGTDRRERPAVAVVGAVSITLIARRQRTRHDRADPRVHVGRRRAAEGADAEARQPHLDPQVFAVVPFRCVVRGGMFLGIRAGGLCIGVARDQLV